MHQGSHRGRVRFRDHQQATGRLRTRASRIGAANHFDAWPRGASTSLKPRALDGGLQPCRARYAQLGARKKRT